MVHTFFLRESIFIQWFCNSFSTVSETMVIFQDRDVEHAAAIFVFQEFSTNNSLCSQLSFFHNGEK